jgi:hypothetical protein
MAENAAEAELSGYQKRLIRGLKRLRAESPDEFGLP